MYDIVKVLETKSSAGDNSIILFFRYTEKHTNKCYISTNKFGPTAVSTQKFPYSFFILLKNFT